MAEYVHFACGMPWKDHNHWGTRTVCPDQPDWFPPRPIDEDEPEPPVSELFDSYEVEEKED